MCKTLNLNKYFCFFFYVNQIGLSTIRLYHIQKLEIQLTLNWIECAKNKLDWINLHPYPGLLWG